MDAASKKLWWRASGVALLVAASAVIFFSYLRPDMVVSFANALVALCGF